MVSPELCPRNSRKRQTLLGLGRRRAAVTLDGAALFVIDANFHGPLSEGSLGSDPTG
jgi:hypothetical protein